MARVKAKAKVKAKPDEIVYARKSSAKNMGDDRATPAPKERGGYSLDHPLARPEARGYPLASTGNGGKGNGSESRQGKGKGSESKQGNGKGRIKSNGKGKGSESKQYALCQGYADDHDIKIMQTTTQHRIRTILIESSDRLTRDPKDQRLPTHQGCNISLSSPATAPP